MMQTFSGYRLVFFVLTLTLGQNIHTRSVYAQSTIVRDALHREAETHFQSWRKQYDARTDLIEIADYQNRLQAEFTERIGGIPRPVALNAVVTGSIQREGYSVEKILFESQPRFFVTGALFLPNPEKFPPPWPAVLVVCGHSAEGKLQVGYQAGTALAALNGLAAMIIDPVGQGERNQVLTKEGSPTIKDSTTEHSTLGTGATLVGWNTARWMIGDGMAAIDYLQSRPDIKGDKIGCMGNSGGGTQTSYLMALDGRIQAAAPSCYITSFKRLLETIGPQDAEQNIFGQIVLGMDHADYLMMRAPKATLIACATKDFFDIAGTWTAYRDAKRLFQRYGAGRNIELVEVDATHGWHPLIRQASVQFMVQHLAGRIVDVADPTVQTLTAQEMNVTPQGQVLLLPNSDSAFDHVRRESQRLAEQRAASKFDAEMLRKSIRTTAAIGELATIPSPMIQQLPQVRIGNLTYQSIRLQCSDGVHLPALIARPASLPDAGNQAAGKPQVTCIAMAEGKNAAVGVNNEVERRVSAGETVMVVDLRGIGETMPTEKPWYHERFGANGGNAVLAYLLGKSLVGMRAEDCLVAARWLAENEGVDTVRLVASGELMIPAIHAAALEPQLIDSVEFRDEAPGSWSKVTEFPFKDNQIVNLVHGALRSYDIPDLTRLMKNRLITPELTQ